MNQVMKSVPEHTRLPASINPILHYALMPFSVVIVILSTAAVIPIFAFSLALHVGRVALSWVPGLSALASRWVKLYHGAIDVLGRRVLTDPRDEPILAAVISLALTSIPIFVAQMIVYELQWYLVVGFYGVVFGPRIRGYVRSFSAMHQEGHRPGGVLKGRSPYEKIFGASFFYTFLSLPMGLIPHAVAHAQQHHRENTGPLDLYASARYDHGNLWHFFRYMTRDLVHQQFMTTPFLYFWRKNKRSQAWAMLKGNIVFFGVVGATALYSWQIALFFFLVPWFASNYLLGIIHWIQHAFYGGQQNPKDYMVNTVTLKETPVNFLNEGLHLCHHHRAGVHWSESPALMEKIRPAMRTAESIVFQDLGVLELYMYLTVLRRFDKLAEKLEPWEPMSQEQRIAYLKMRSRQAPEFLSARTG